MKRPVRNPGTTLRRSLALVLALVLVFFCMPTFTGLVQAAPVEYEIYPTPHLMEYLDGTYIIRNEVNVVYDNGIDQATKDRLEEIVALKSDLTLTESQAIVPGKTNILVGIDGSGGYVDTYAEDIALTTADLYSETDAYLLHSEDGVITVVGRDTDSAFYGLTSLYHIVKQMDSYTIRNFHMEDWADVATRGTIEGYYGNPWSVQDRCDVMTWGGYYKLNAYIYAPKDDPKHNSEWRELYTDEEIENEIKPMAEAGNASKCRFVFALHCFMYDPIRFDSNYEADLAVVQAKFTQVIEAGVRQIAILADDAAGVGAANYQKFLVDMTDWMEEMRETYPDLKMNLPFVPVEYYTSYQGYFSGFPENVQIVMTGNGVWGQTSVNFTETFYNNVGRGPFMWINWPCSDASKNNLIMGGYDYFLHPGVDPDKLEGIVLNPMQQSEPSKVAIFGNACYCWNIWESVEEADAAWEASFKYVDHNSAIENEASKALRELCKHMIYQNGNTSLDESEELQPKLNDFMAKINAGTVTAADVDAMIEEFVILQDAADTYEAQAGDTKFRDQIVYWLDCWDDTTDAAIAYLNGVKAVLAGDTAAVLQYNTAGSTAYEASKDHPLWYLNHWEYAIVGMKHIVPFIRNVAAYVEEEAQAALGSAGGEEDPGTTGPITGTVTQTGMAVSSGSLANLVDGSTGTGVHLYNNGGGSPIAGATITVTFDGPKDVGTVTVSQGVGAYTGDILLDATLQYQVDGQWLEAGSITGENQQSVAVNAENVTAIRIVNNADMDTWLYMNEIQILPVGYVAPPSPEPITYKLMIPSHWGYHSGNASMIYDGNDNTYVWFNQNLALGDYIGYDLSEVLALKSAHIVMGYDGADKMKNYTIETSLDGENWTSIPGYERYTGNELEPDVLDIDLGGRKARYIRIRGLDADRAKWIKFSEFTVEQVSPYGTEYVYTNTTDIIYSSESEGAVSLQPLEITLDEGQYVGVKLSNIKHITSVLTSQLPAGVKLQTSLNGVEWTDYTGAIDGRYARILATQDGVALDLDQFDVSYAIVGPKAVTSDFANNEAASDMRTIGTVKNLLDGDLTTAGTITGAQEAGKHITLDLGQEIHFTALRYYIAEADLNYLRNADISISADGEQWTKVMTVGQTTADEFDESTAKDASYLTHDTNNPGYMYAEATGLDVSGRYIRITPNEDYSHRWVTINELQINGGAYISAETDRDIISDTPEVESMEPSNALDGDFATSYKPSAGSGSFTYRISEPESVGTIRIIQLGAVSNATVTATFIGEEGTVTLGKLSQPINEFTIPEGKLLGTVTVTWTDVIPQIAEIVSNSQRQTDVDKTALEEAIAKPPADNWTTSSRDAYDAALALAEQLLESPYATQASVDSACGALVNAYNSAQIKASDLTAHQALVERRLSNQDVIYTTVSFDAYEVTIEALADALTDPDDLTQAEADDLKADVEAAIAALEYSLRNRELAELAGESYASVDGEEYTADSYQALTDAYNAMMDLVNEDKQAEVTEGDRVDPYDLIEAREAYEAAMAGLVKEGETAPTTEPSEPSTEPSEPSTEPSEPSTEPSEPSTEPSEPSTEPSEPGTEPSEPGTEPSEPGTEPSEPGTEPSEPGTEPSEPGTEPSEPGTDPTEPSPGTGDTGLRLWATTMIMTMAVLATVVIIRRKEA